MKYCYMYMYMYICTSTCTTHTRKYPQTRTSSRLDASSTQGASVVLVLADENAVYDDGLDE